MGQKSWSLANVTMLPDALQERLGVSLPEIDELRPAFAQVVPRRSPLSTWQDLWRGLTGSPYRNGGGSLHTIPFAEVVSDSVRDFTQRHNEPQPDVAATFLLTRFWMLAHMDRHYDVSDDSFLHFKDMLAVSRLLLEVIRHEEVSPELVACFVARAKEIQEDSLRRREKPIFRCFPSTPKQAKSTRGWYLNQAASMDEIHLRMERAMSGLFVADGRFFRTDQELDSLREKIKLRLDRREQEDEEFREQVRRYFRLRKNSLLDIIPKRRKLKFDTPMSVLRAHHRGLIRVAATRNGNRPYIWPLSHTLRYAGC